MRILPMGDRALLAEVGSLDEVVALHAALAASAPAGVIDLVPAARTVLVRIDPRMLRLAAARAWLASTDAVSGSVAAAAEVTLEIAYDGADLAGTADLLGTTVDELVHRHRGARWTVAFTGFAPGFGYLTSPDWPYDVPRLATPRTRVPAGAVGVAAGFTGAYPRATPGGWRLIGRTGAALFDPSAASPVLLAPGVRVRFHEVAAVRPVATAARPLPVPPPGLRVQRTGPQASVQDLGRPGSAALGVAASGALDPAALRLGNRLVGNPEAAAAIEVALGGFSAVAERDLWAAVTGAAGPTSLDGRPLPVGVAVPWPAGTELALGWFTAGARAYLAVRGGIVTESVLGSRSTDVLAGLGVRVAAGVRLPVGDAYAGPIPAIDPVPGASAGDPLEVDLLPGPRTDWFPASAVAALYGEWSVGTESDRVGMRLDGPEIERTRSDELPSEGMVPGAIQVPPSGRPTILLADGPVTGGYPVIAVVAEESLAVLAQAGPGTRLRLRRARRTG